jgi:hypothetical protein
MLVANMLQPGPLPTPAVHIHRKRPEMRRRKGCGTMLQKSLRESRHRAARAGMACPQRKCQKPAKTAHFRAVKEAPA